MAENNVVEVQNQNNVSLEDILQKERSVAPLVDIYETNDDFVMVANMPGANRELIQLKLEDNSLMIFGKINYDDVINRKYILNENEIGNYYRKFRISNSVDESKIEATYENGQLFVKLPKHERVKPRTINIK